MGKITFKKRWNDCFFEVKYYKYRYASPLNVTVKSSISKNTDLITDKIRIRRNREQLQKMYQRGLENRIKETKYAFDLPNKGP